MELTEKVTNTLIEQIDTLTNIATEFSSFAQMPGAMNEHFDLNEVINYAVDLYKENNEVEINGFMKSDEAHWVYADKKQVLRVFNNLIQNSIQAIPDDRKGIVNVDVKKEGKYIVASVEDNGLGISPEQKHKVFAPNFTSKTSGTGLGLAMSKNIIELSGGEIWFKTSPGEGTTFNIKLPQSNPQNEVEPQT